MRNEYKMETVANYLQGEIEYTSISEEEVERQVARYLASKENKIESLVKFLAV